MTFTVQPAALRTAAAQLNDAAQAVHTANRYAEQYGQMNWHDQGPISVAIGAHNDFLTQLNQQLRHLIDLLTDSDVELVKAADSYERSDQTTSATIDATYPTVPHRTDPSPTSTAGL